MDVKMSGGIHQRAAVDIHKEAEMAAEKTCAKNGVCDVSNDKHPWENPVEAQVQGEGMLTKCCNA